jgi:pimeloyl-ACP methyl ester carboxylesterase
VAASSKRWTRIARGPVRWQSDDPTDAVATTPGIVEAVTYLRSYSKWQLRALVRLARLPESLPITCGITMYRVVYWTHHLGTPERVSGLFALPTRVNPKATVMWLHGTSVQRVFAPSTPTREEGVLVSAAYSGNGFLTIAPDYVGLGQSQSYHPYLYTPTTVNAARDLLTAAQTVAAGMAIPWKSKLFVAGFSQGASAAAVVQRSIEAEPAPNIELLATAAMAPPAQPCRNYRSHCVGQFGNNIVALPWVHRSFVQQDLQPRAQQCVDRSLCVITTGVVQRQQRFGLSRRCATQGSKNNDPPRVFEGLQRIARLVVSQCFDGERSVQLGAKE